MQECLDATGPGREVVGHDQGLVHRRRQYLTHRWAVLHGPCTVLPGIMARMMPRIPVPAVLVWAATRALLLLCVLKVITVPGPDVTSDVSVIYRDWYGVLRTGTFPLDDVTWQYPPAAAARDPLPRPPALPVLRHRVLRARPPRRRAGLRAPRVRGRAARQVVARGVGVGRGGAAARSDRVRPLRRHGHGGRGGRAAGRGPASARHGGAHGARRAAEGVAPAPAARDPPRPRHAGFLGQRGPHVRRPGRRLRGGDAGRARLPHLPARPRHGGRVARRAGVPRGAAVRLARAGRAELRLDGVPRPVRERRERGRAGADDARVRLAADVAAAGRGPGRRARSRTRRSPRCCCSRRPAG